MAGGKFSEAKLHGMTIRESADDGSDFTNPDADYRRLFLGEDGDLHLKDSSGTVTDIGGGGGDITTDPAWAAAGDLIVGSGDDAAAVLTAGSEGEVLTIASGVPAWEAAAGGALATGTSFPVSPTTGDRYRRSDLDYMVFFYDGTQWVTEQIFSINGNARFDDEVNISGNKVDLLGNISRGGTLAVQLLRADFGAYVATTNDGSRYWWADVQTMAAGATAGTTRFSPNTTGITASQYHVITDDTPVVVAAADCAMLRVIYTKVSTPGNLYPTLVVYYRLIAT